MKKFRQLFYLFSITLSNVWATLTVTGSITQGSGESVPGYYNKGSTAVSVTITIDGEDAGVYDAVSRPEGRQNFYVNIYYDVESAVSDLWSGGLNNSYNQFTGADDLNLRQNPRQITSTLTYTFDVDDLQTAGAVTGKYIDFKINFSQDYLGSVIGSTEEVSFGGVDYFRFDIDIPSISDWDTPGNGRTNTDTIFFNSDQIKYTLSEDLSTTIDSYIRFTVPMGVRLPIRSHRRLHQ